MAKLTNKELKSKKHYATYSSYSGMCLFETLKEAEDKAAKISAQKANYDTDVIIYQSLKAVKESIPPVEFVDLV